MTKLAIKLLFALALAGFSTTATVGPAFAADEKKEEKKADKADKKKKSEKKDEAEKGW